MATYSATDFLDKTIWITDTVPVYKFATKEGDTKPTPFKFLQRGDSFIVKDFLGKVSPWAGYPNYIDNYWLLDTGGVISFKDITGKYDTKAILDQGVKSDKEKATTTTKAEELIKKYLPYILGTVLVAVVAKAYISKKS
jgi:hypothetical protein